MPRFWVAAFSLFLLIWLAAFVYACAGVRGSDQYWYVSEVRAVMAQDPRTNSLWPHFLLNDPGYLDARPFIHQGVMPYILGSLGGLLSPYGAWIAFNLLATVLSSGLIFATLRRLSVDGRIALVAAACFLALPITMWYASQPLVESTIALLCALMMTIAVSHWGRLIKFIALIGLAVIGQQVLTIFLPALVAILVAFLWAEWSRGGERSIPRTILYLGISMVGLFLATLKASTLGFGMTQLMMNGIPGNTNMDIWLREESLPFAFGPFAQKVMTNLSAFLKPSSSQIFFFPPFALILLILFALIRNWRGTTRSAASGRDMLLTYLCAVGLLTYGAVITLHQNQARYLLYILPLLIVTATYFYRILIERILSRHVWIFGGAGIALLAACALLATQLRGEAAAAARDIAALQAAMKDNPQLREARTVIECYQGEGSLLIDYALFDRLVVHVAPERAGAQLRRLADKSGAHLLLCPTDIMNGIRDRAADLHLTTIATIEVGEVTLEAAQIP